MPELKVNTKIINKHSPEKTTTTDGVTHIGWEDSSYIPLLGELIVYDPDESYSFPRYKIGDGVTLVSSLPFLGSAVWIGTQAEYPTAYASGLIPVGTIVYITDDEETGDIEEALDNILTIQNSLIEGESV